MNRLSYIVLVLLVALPGLGSAQTTDAPVTASGEPPTPPLVTAPPEPAPPPIHREIIPRRVQPQKDSPGTTYPHILVSSVVGSLTGAGGGIAGYLVSRQFSRCNVFDDVCRDLTPVAVPALLGAGSFSALTVYGLGSLLDGQGTLLGTLVGGFVATGLSVPLVFWIRDYESILIIPVMASIGSIIGYEVYSPPAEPSPRQTLSRRGDVQLLPVLGVTPAGGVLGGLMGRF